jgi:hypothetical protein
LKFKKRKIKTNKGENSLINSPSNASMMSVAAIEKMIVMNMESDMKELPGQSEIFEGKPMFQQLYH